MLIVCEFTLASACHQTSMTMAGPTPFTDDSSNMLVTPCWSPPAGHWGYSQPPYSPSRIESRS